MKTPHGVMFEEMKVRLDGRSDQRERVIQVSREVTIESKRVIFLLHRVSSASATHDGIRDIIKEATHKLLNIRTLFAKVAKDMHAQDFYR